MEVETQTGRDGAAWRWSLQVSLALVEGREDELLALVGARPGGRHPDELYAREPDYLLGPHSILMYASWQGMARLTALLISMGCDAAGRGRHGATVQNFGILRDGREGSLTGEEKRAGEMLVGAAAGGVTAPAEYVVEFVRRPEPEEAEPSYKMWKSWDHQKELTYPEEFEALGRHLPAEAPAPLPASLEPGQERPRGRVWLYAREVEAYRRAVEAAARETGAAGFSLEPVC